MRIACYSGGSRTGKGIRAIVSIHQIDDPSRVLCQRDQRVQVMALQCGIDTIAARQLFGTCQRGQIGGLLRGFECLRFDHELLTEPLQLTVRMALVERDDIG